MRRSVARHSFERARHIEHLAHGNIAVILSPQLRICIESLIYRHFEVERYRLGNGVRLGVRQIERPSHIAHRRFRFKRTERDYLRHLVRTVFIYYVVYDLAAPFVAEVYIYIRHRHSLRVQKTLEEQIVLYRVDVP